MKRSAKLGIGAIIAIMVLCAAMYGQQNVGAIKGVAQDPSGGVIVGASVLVQQIETGIETKGHTNAEGAYSFTSLNVGLYDLTVTFEGFRTIRKTSLRVVSGITLTQDIELPVGEPSQVPTESLWVVQKWLSTFMLKRSKSRVAGICEPSQFCWVPERVGSG